MQDDWNWNDDRRRGGSEWERRAGRSDDWRDDRSMGSREDYSGRTNWPDRSSGGGYGGGYDRDSSGRDYGGGSYRDRDYGGGSYGGGDYGRTEYGRSNRGRGNYSGGGYGGGFSGGDYGGGAGGRGFGRSNYAGGYEDFGRSGGDRQYRGMTGGGYGSYGDVYSDDGMSARGAQDFGQGYGSREDSYRSGFGGSGYGGGYGDYGRQSGGMGGYGGQSHGERDELGWTKTYHRGKGPKGYARSDERIREDVSDRLSDDPMLDATNIDVNVESGEVTLSGTVESRRDKRRAEDIADDVSGVNHVQNNLRVSSGQSSTMEASND